MVELPEWCKPFHAGGEWSTPTIFDDLLVAIEKHSGVKALHRTPLQHRIKALITNLRAPEKEIRMAAAKTLALIGKEAEDAVLALGEALRDESPEVRLTSVNGLRDIGSRANAVTPALIDALTDDEFDIQVAAFQTLAAIGAEAVPALVRLLKDGSESLINDAARLLGNIGSGDEATVSALINVLKKNDGRTYWAVVDALGRFGEKATPAVPVLVNMLKDGDRETYRHVTAALIRSGVEGARALFHALRQQDTLFRLWPASDDLGEIGPECITAVPVLIDALREYQDEYQDDYSYIHYFASAALVKIGSQAVPALVALLEEKDFNARKAAATTLAGIGPNAVDAIPALMKKLRENDWDLRQYATSALSSIGWAAVPALIEALRADENTSTRASAAWALGLIGSKGNPAIVVPALIEALRDDNDEVHRKVIAALGVIGPKARDAIPALEKELEGRWHADAHHALQRIIPKARTEP